MIFEKNNISSDQEIGIVDTSFADTLSIHAVPTGSLAGKFEISYSNTKENFIPDPNGVLSFVALEASEIEIVNIAAKYVKINLIDVSGTGNLKVSVFTKVDD